MKDFFIRLLTPLFHSLPKNVWGDVLHGTRIMVQIQHCLERKFHDSGNRNGPTSRGNQWQGICCNNHPRSQNHDKTKYNKRRIRMRSRWLWRKKRLPRTWRKRWELQPTIIHIITSKLQGRNRSFQRSFRDHGRSERIQGPIQEIQR